MFHVSQDRTITGKVATSGTSDTQLPFEHVCLDYMSLNGASYGVFVDRYTGWPGVYRGDAAKDVVTFLARLCEDYKVPVTCSTD
jgi:hypothetical protein